jgi:hypothetical protein
MKVSEEFAFRFSRASAHMGQGGIAQIVVRGVLTHAAQFQRWVMELCDSVQARGVVIDLRLAVVAVDWATYLVDPSATLTEARMLPIALVANLAVLDDLRDLTWHRAKQGHMRSVFPDAASATTWAVDRAWVDLPQ